jgi:hypothetical protein
MVRIKSATEIDRKYKAAIANVPAAYKDGVQATTDWKAKALEGQDLYEAQMQNRTVLQRRAKGLQAVTDDDWKKNAAEKGSARIGAGMTAGADKRTKNYEPYRKEIESIVLPARTADPMQNVQNRVGPIAVRLRELKNKS